MNTTGIRFGTQVVTRRGMDEDAMKTIARAVARVLLHGEDPDRVNFTMMRLLAEQFRRCRYSFDRDFPLDADWYNTAYERLGAETTLDAVTALIPFADCTADQLLRISRRFKRCNFDRYLLSLQVLDKLRVKE